MRDESRTRLHHHGSDDEDESWSLSQTSEKQRCEVNLRGGGGGGSPGMDVELLEPESSTGPKKSRFNKDEPPLAAEPGGDRG